MKHLFLTLLCFFALYFPVSVLRYAWVHDDLTDMQLLKRLPDILAWR